MTFFSYIKKIYHKVNLFFTYTDSLTNENGTYNLSKNFHKGKQRQV